MILSLGVTLYGALQGYAAAQYDPRIIVKGLPLTPGSAIVFGGYLIFCLMPVVMELFDRQMWKIRRNAVEKQTIGGFRLWEV